MKFFSLSNKKNTKDALKINILNGCNLPKKKIKEIEKIAIEGINCGDSLKNISSTISKRLNIPKVQVYKHFERIDIMI